MIILIMPGRADAAQNGLPGQPLLHLHFELIHVKNWFGRQQEHGHRHFPVIILLLSFICVLPCQCIEVGE